jgi:rhodanese-related sulfurtransferase
MGPLVPDILTNELNLVVALLVGIAFGYILEQAGFSSSRKLTGLFYGTDFTVLRVCFTAGLTAMIGVLLLARRGLLDASIIYVNPAFVPSAIIGGLVMGAGFVIGGFCPGTSFCAAAVGRVDGMVFVAGGLAGAFVFGEAFPSVRRLYEAGSLGDVTVPAYFGISPGSFVIIMCVVAVAAFAATGRIERHVNPDAPVHAFSTGRHRLAATGFLAIAIVTAVVPDSRTQLLANAADEPNRRAHPVARMTADELAYRIVDRDPALVVVDVRPAADFAKGSLPGAVNMAVGDFFGRAMPPTIAQAHRRKVFVADDESEAETAATLAALLGFANVAVLRGGWSGFRSVILERTAQGGGNAVSADVAAFRADAGQQIAALMKTRPRGAGVVRRSKKIAGGCGV